MSLWLLLRNGAYLMQLLAFSDLVFSLQERPIQCDREPWEQFCGRTHLSARWCVEIAVELAPSQADPLSRSESPNFYSHWHLIFFSTRSEVIFATDLQRQTPRVFDSFFVFYFYPVVARARPLPGRDVYVCKVSAYLMLHSADISKKRPKQKSKLRGSSPNFFIVLMRSRWERSRLGAVTVVLFFCCCLIRIVDVPSSFSLVLDVSNLNATYVAWRQHMRDSKFYV